MQPKQKMIHIVGTAIEKVLRKKSTQQINLASESARYEIASEILDDVLRTIEKPEFKEGVKNGSK
ncbi:MAG TPA: hypothetical protein DEQ25_05735 [Methylophaga sp.]|nr:hypothetical protein [Methylophaga sp.]